MTRPLTAGQKYYLSCWYKRSELGIRAAVFFSAAAFAGSFGGLLAAAIEKLHGVGGKPGWAWIFILEGLATVLAGVASHWLVHDFPDRAGFLGADERLRVQRRIAADRPAGVKLLERFDMAFFWQSVKDWKTWLFAVVYMGTDGSLYAFSLFLPTIIKQLGTYSPTHANLLTVPPYAAAAVATVLVGWYADRTGRRGACNISMAAVGIAGFAMLLGAKEAKVKYAGHVPGCGGDIPDDREHDLVVQQQRRGRVQAGRDAGDRDRVGEPERRGVEQHLPDQGRAALLPRPRHGAGVSGRVPARRVGGDDAAAEEGECEEGEG